LASDASRFAHYIKKIGREKVGSFQTRAGLEKYLNNWIADYVPTSPPATSRCRCARWTGTGCCSP
jgi:predicted component of type VI protein secretion system